MDFKTLLVLACVAAGCLAGPVRETYCSEECNSRDDEGMFRAFKSYYYSYVVDIDSRINGTNGDQSSSVRVEALATIEGLSACEMVLKLTDITIKERRQDGIMVAAETSTTFSSTLMAHPLRFSMESDGTITSVCPEAGEEIWALNVKRGFLSHIQTKRTTPNSVFGQAGVFETSVTGTCMPVYSSTGPQTFHKSNDYLMCKHRTNLNMFVDAIPVHLLAPTASPLSSRMDCSYEMDSQRISSIECHETHTLKPFAESDSKPETVVHTVITYAGINPSISSSLSSEFSRRTSLLYEDPIQVSEITSDDVRSTITQICDSVANGVSSETPGLFETLTKQFGELDTDNMNTVINRLFRICPQVQTNEVINMVKDALTDCDTEQCAQGFHSIIRSENSENEFYLRKWFMKLVFHKNPTKNMINLVHSYAQSRPEVKLPAYYALSSMIHQYCHMSEDDCSRDEDILNAARIFEDNLHDSCQPENDEDQKMILMSLRAIGNMGLIQSNRLLTRCSRVQNPDQLRVAAIDAYRRVSCVDVPIERFMSIFTTIENDSELRIAAYRAIIRCPAEVLLRGIADAMADEPTNQVTCYVASHLANLRNSQDPMVHDLQMALSQSPLVNVTKCGMDYRKFSHNYGLSYFDDESGNGIHFDSDVVFSSKSYLPRSARLAMNVDLFGYAFDLFEMDTRLEGWQDALESFMAPDEDEREANMIEKVKRMMYGQVYRQRREAIKNTAINKIKKEYESSHVMEQEVSQKASFAMKVLGNDVLYKDQDDFQRMAEMFSKERILEIITSLASQRTHEYSLNRNFKPSKVTIPTMTGMPLEVNIQGAFNTILKASGKLDVMGMMASPRRMTVQGLFEPSAAIEIHSNMMVDAHCARSGLSHKTTLASSLSLGGSLSFENGMLRAKVNAPPRRETIISASSSLYYMQRNELVPVSEPEDAVLTIDETLSNPRYNLHVNGVRPNIPFSLPEAFFHNWALEVTLDKLEENLVSYDLEAGFRTDKAFRNGQIEKTDHIHFLIGAPTSETIGAFSMDLAYHRSNATLIINTESPKGSTYFIGFLRNETNSKRLHLQQTVSDQTYVFEAGMDTVPLTDGWKFVPVFMVTVPNVVSYNLQGHVSCTGEEKVWDLSLVDGAQQKLAALTGDLIRNNTIRRMSLAGNFGSFSGSLQGGYRIEETSTSVLITPIFSLNSPFPRVTLSIGGGPLVISNNGVTMNELYLTSTNTRLIEVSNLHLQKRQRSFGFQGKIKETIPFGIEFDMTNDEQRQYSVDLTLTSIIGEYNVRGLLFNKSSDFIYRLEVITSVNNTEYFNVTTEFKNEINAHQYLDTIIGFRGQQIYRTKNGLQTQALSAKTRYTPIFMLETNQLGSLTSEGSFDVSESGILINNMALVGAEDIFRLSGSASVDRDARSVSWSLNVDGAYITEVISGSASHRDNQVLFQTSMTSESSSLPDYSLTIDLQNSTVEGEIFSWDGKVELNMPHHPELSFRMDTEYTLRPGHSSGNVFRLCYDGNDCTSTEKRITLSHDLTFSHVKKYSYTDRMEVTYTHPAVNTDITLEWTTSCIHDETYGTHLTLRDHEQDLFTTEITYIPDLPEEPSRNGSIYILLRAPDYFDYEFTDTFHFDSQVLFWLSKYKSGQDVMSFLVRFNMTIEDLRFWKSAILEYTDIRNNVFTLEYINTQNDPGNKLHSMTIKKNSDLKMFNFQKTTTEISETGMLSHYSYILRTTFQPVQDLSYNQTLNINPQNGNVNLDLRLRFMPGQKPISLITHFTNRSTDAKKEGQIITTLSLPKTSITVLTEGKLEKGVPSGNLSIKFQPLMGSTETYAVELTMKNRSSSPSQIYDSALIFTSPDANYGLKHTVEWSEMVFFPMTSSLTGFWGDEEVTVTSTLTHHPSQDSGELELSLTIPEPDHVYLFSGRFDGDSVNITISKDSNPIFLSSFSGTIQESLSGYTCRLNIHENVMSYGSETTVTLSKTSNAYHFNLQMQENDKEALYTDVSLDLFPDQVRFDLATEARSHYLPGYNTKVDVNYQKTELVHTFAWTLKVEDTKVFGITFRNSSSTDEPNSRVTQLTFTQPTNPDFRLRSVVLTDSCSMSRQRITHNTTVMWGSQLPIETIAFNFIGNRNDAGSEATLMLRNEGLVFGFGRYYTLALGKTRTGSEQTGTITVTGETGNIFSLQTELTNRSRDSLKSYETSITVTVLDRHPITIETSLVHNSMSDAILDAELTITYSTDTDQRLTAGIEVTRVPNGHSVVLNLQHLVNTIDVMIVGTYSNSSEMFSMTLENSVLLGDERHQPEITFSLNRTTNQVSFKYTGIRTYEFTGQFLNRFTEEGRVDINWLYAGDRTFGFSGQFLNWTNEDGRVYEINCYNIYSRGRVVPYKMFFSETQKLVGMTVQYNPENPEDIWKFTAGYQNDTAIFASLDTIHSGQTIHNGSIVLSLDNNVPKVLTTQIKWEPSWPQDLKAAVLNIVNKTKELRDDKYATMCSMALVQRSNWKALAQRMNDTMKQFMLANVNIYTRMLMLKTQVETQWTLNQPFRMGQLRFLTEKWMQFNQTLHANLLGADWGESSRAYQQFAAEFEDINDYFSPSFNMFSEDVLIEWMLFEVALTAIKDQFDGEAIATHWHASMEAQDAFFNSLWEQFELDIANMDPNWDALKERLDTIGQNLKAIGPRISEEFNSRIAALNVEKTAIMQIVAAIVEDIKAFNTTLRGAVARWEQAADRELEPFRNTDFSWAVNLVRELNETIRTLVNEEKALGYFQMTSETFKAPYAEILTRGRRQAPDLSGRRTDNLDTQSLAEALAKFSSYGVHNTPSQVNIPSLPTYGEVEEVQKSACNFTAILNVLKKVFNGTYELSKLDLVNGEIIFKIFIKDFSNYTSLTNLTREYLDMLPLDALKKINITKVQKMISMLHEGSLSEFKARFMEQFTADRTYYEELMQELQTKMESRIQNEVENRIVPYLESMGDRIVEGGRPFFGRWVDLPDQEVRQSFLRQLITEMDIGGLTRMMGRMKQTMCGVRNTMYTAASRVKMATCPRSWMPPYKANALVIGAKHYMTFDKQFYDFSGKCGYLLAKDFVHENDFSAIVDYERDMDIPIRNMMFMINSTTFEIKSDGTVIVNRQARELPLQVDDTAIMRIGDSIKLKNAHGVSLVCKLPHDVCALKLKGRYFDRTAGLLGNFNFEPYDDFKTPGNVLQTNITAFTESWKVGKNCIQSETTSLDLNRVIPSMDRIVNFDPLHPDNQACASMFLDNCSPLARCHGAVDPDSFYRMCILDSNNLPEEEKHTKRCSIAAAYKTQCWYAKNPVGMPEECITCNIGEESFEAGKPITIEGDDVPRIVDIVFVVEEKRCNEENTGQLNNLVSRLAGELQDAGYDDTQFGLAAFGGSGVHDAPHPHTINHKIFNDNSRDFTLGSDSLEFADDGSNDTFAAIKLAADYPFRAGAAKHIILLPCTEMAEEDTRLSFEEMSVMLRKRAISLTVLMDYQFRLSKQFKSISKSKSKSKSERVYGIDTKSTYTSKMADLVNFKGSSTLRQFTDEPEGRTALLAQESGGAIFDSSMLRDKGFNEVFVKRLVMKSEPEQCQVCRCVPDEMVGVGRSVCEKCVNPLNVFGEEIRAALRGFELKHGLPHWRYDDQIPEEEEE